MPDRDEDLHELLGSIRARIEDVRHAQDTLSADVKSLLTAQASAATEIRNLKDDVGRAHARIGKLERAGIPDEDAIVRRTREESADRVRLKAVEDGVASIQSARAVVRSEGWSIAKAGIVGAAGGTIALALKALSAWLGIGGP